MTIGSRYPLKHVTFKRVSVKAVGSENYLQEETERTAQAICETVRGHGVIAQILGILEAIQPD
jgi:hypothetical protein